MSSLEEQILRAAKEIAVKFIETGRLTPNGFRESFEMIYATLDRTVKAHRGSPPDSASPVDPEA